MKKSNLYLAAFTILLFSIKILSAPQDNFSAKKDEALQRPLEYELGLEYQSYFRRAIGGYDSDCFSEVALYFFENDIDKSVPGHYELVATISHEGVLIDAVTFPEHEYPECVVGKIKLHQFLHPPADDWLVHFEIDWQP